MIDRDEVDRQLDSASGREGGGREIDVLRVRILADVREQLRASNLLALADALDRRAGAGRSQAATGLRVEAAAVIGAVDLPL